MEVEAGGEAGEPAELRGDGARELVVEEPEEAGQRREPPKLRRNRPATKPGRA